LHFGSSFIGKRDRKYSVRPSPMPDEIGDPVGDDPRLARSGSRQDEQWAAQGLYRGTLASVQSVERHSADLKHCSLI
jgi:hypothetical protein